VKGRAARSFAIAAVWSAGECLASSFPIPVSGIVLGRELLECSDVSLSRQHARIERGDRMLLVSDLESPNGTFVGGHLAGERGVAVLPGAVIRTGQTVWVITERADDLRVATVVRDLKEVIRSIDGKLEVHASAIEASLLELQRSSDPELLMKAMDVAARTRSFAGGGTLRGTDITPDPPAVNCVFPYWHWVRQSAADELVAALRAVHVEARVLDGVSNIKVEARRDGTRRALIRLRWHSYAAGRTLHGKPYEGAGYVLALLDDESTLAEGETCDIAIAITAIKSWLIGGPLPELFTIVS
jgi:hypothetical protein